MPPLAGPREPGDVAGRIGVMILIRRELHAGAEGANQGGEADGIGDPRRDDHSAFRQRRQLDAPARLESGQSAEREMDPSDDRVWPPAAEVPRERARLGDRRTAPRHDDDIRAAQGAPVFAPGTGRQRPRHVARRRTLRAHDGDVDVARDIEPLIGVIEHEHPRPPGAGFLGARQPVGVGDDDRIRHEPLMHCLLVSAIAA